MIRLALAVLCFAAPVTASAKSFNAGRGTTWDCAKDPDVTINHSNGTYTFKGACKKISVNGSSLKITIESVDRLSVNGSANTIAVTAVDDLSVNGSQNQITYARGVQRATPAISNRGVGNTITASGKAPDAKPADKPAEAKPSEPAVAGTLIDCDKSPMFSTSDNGATFTLTGACAAVAVSGNHNKLVIASAKKVAISGNHNTVDVAAVDDLAVSGNHNAATWKKGLSKASARVRNSGKDNTVTQAK
jgi:hypothetical protein